MNVGASTACQTNVPVWIERSSTSWTTNATGGSSAKAEAGRRSTCRPRAASAAAKASATSATAAPAASTNGSRSR